MKVLLVEDDEDLRRMLEAVMLKAGYECLAFGRIADALASPLIDDIGAAVLDMQLPDGDGIELATRLKSRATAAKRIPVIVMSGVDEVGSRVRALTDGADDFILKPFDLREFEVRLSAQIARSVEVMQLADANRRLREVERKKRDLAALVVHDLRNPIAGVIGAAEMLAAELGQAEPDRQAQLQMIEQIELLSHKALSHLAGILDVEELEEGMLVARVEEVSLANFLGELVRPYRRNLESRQLTLEVEVEPDGRAKFDPSLVGRIVENLLDNGVRYASRKGRVAVRVRREQEELVIAVGNDGPPIPEDQRSRIFDRYHRVEERRVSARENRGLGLYFCRLAAEAHGGRIEVGADGDLRAAFFVRLPQGQAEPAQNSP